jgi:hypothetical protein
MIAMSRECSRVEYDYTKQLELLCGRLDGSTAVKAEVVGTGDDASVAFELKQQGTRVEITATPTRADFAVVLPWASEVRDVEGADVVTGDSRGERLPGDPEGGVVLRATQGRVVFTWS